MRNLLLIGAAAAFAVGVPMAYESSPETFHRLVAPAAERASEPLAAPAPAAVPAAAQPSTMALQGRKVRVLADSAGHFNAELKFNGRRIDGMIDTGASLVAINNSTARRIGLIVAPAEFRHEVGTANGKTRAALVKIEAIEIGRIRVENVDAVVLDDRALSTTLIGMSLLRQLNRFEVENGVLLLEQ